MEIFAYEYATKNLCYPKNESNPRVPMYKLFDLVAGTSTGSLLATTVVLPESKENRVNKYWADDAISIYVNNGTAVFKKYELSKITYSTCIIILIVVGAVLGYYIG